MIHFLAPVLRTQFNLFFRHGYTYIAKSALLEFDGQITDELQHKLALHFEQFSPFEYEQEYVILHLTEDSQSDLTGNMRFDITKLNAVFPLTLQAKRTLEDRIDPRIRIEDPVFASAIQEHEKTLSEEEARKGIEALWTICNLSDNPHEAYSRYAHDIDAGMQNRRLGMKPNQIDGGSFISYLLAYERYAFFPKTTLGYFYDAGEIFSYQQGKSDGLTGTKLKSVLDELHHQKAGIKVPEIAAELSSRAPERYLSVMVGDPPQLQLVSLFFLKWKDELRDEEKSVRNTTLFLPEGKGIAFLKDYPEEVKLAILLLGAFFGYKRFYNDYYDSLGLSFLKQKSREQLIEAGLSGESASDEGGISTPILPTSPSDTAEDVVTSVGEVENSPQVLRDGELAVSENNSVLEEGNQVAGSLFADEQELDIVPSVSPSDVETALRILQEVPDLISPSELARLLKKKKIGNGKAESIKDLVDALIKDGHVKKVKKNIQPVKRTNELRNVSSDVDVPAVPLENSSS